MARGRSRVLLVTAEAQDFSHLAYIKHLLCAKPYSGHRRTRCCEPSKEYTGKPQSFFCAW